MMQRYHIILAGKKPEADTEKVVSAMTQLFKVSTEKAHNLLAKPTIVKRNLDRNTAKKYRAKLVSIGLKVTVRAVNTAHNHDEVNSSPSSNKRSAADKKTANHSPINNVAELSLIANPNVAKDDTSAKTTQDSVNFSLVAEQHPAITSKSPSAEPIKPEPQMSANFSSLSLVEEPEPPATENNTLTANRDEVAGDSNHIDMNLSSALELSGTADAGVQVEQPSSPMTARNNVNSTLHQPSLDTIEVNDYDTDIEPTNFLNRRLIDDITLLSIIVGIVTAILGALLWRVIAVTFNVEIAWVAMLIGGAIGFAVATSGGHGRSTGILCAVLATAAIMLGKYWAIQGIMSNVMNELKTTFEPQYIMMQEASKAYNSSMTDQEFIDFFNQYSTSFEEFGETEFYLDDSSPEEISAMRTVIEPELKKISEMSFAEWYETELLVQIESMQDEMGFTAGDLVKKDFDIIDAIFLLVGVFAAFKVGSGDD